MNWNKFIGTTFINPNTPGLPPSWYEEGDIVTIITDKKAVKYRIRKAWAFSYEGNWWYYLTTLDGSRNEIDKEANLKLAVEDPPPAYSPEHDPPGYSPRSIRTCEVM
jgi:hypothetical protein